MLFAHDFGLIRMWACGAPSCSIWATGANLWSVHGGARSVFGPAQHVSHLSPL